MFHNSNSLLFITSRLFIALGLGILIGLERERSESGGAFAGSRTFPLFALYGALIQEFFPDVFSISLVILILLNIVILAILNIIGTNLRRYDKYSKLNEENGKNGR